MKLLSEIKRYSLFFICIAAISCSDDDGKGTRIVTMRINHYTQPCAPFESQQCPVMLVQEGNAVGSDQWKQVYSIDGFEFEPGYTYDLVVEKTPAGNRKRNMPDYVPRPAYTWQETVTKTKVPIDETFEIWLYSRLITSSQSNFTLNDGTAIDCGSLCDQFAAAAEADFAFTAVFKHIDPTTIQLVEIRE